MLNKKINKFSKKAQGLPMTTIVLIILVIIVLVGVAIFFFTSFGEGQKGVSDQIIFSRCQSACARIQAGGSKNEYCSHGESPEFCNDYMSCEYPEGHDDYEDNGDNIVICP